MKISYLTWDVTRPLIMILYTFSINFYSIIKLINKLWTWGKKKLIVHVMVYIHFPELDITILKAVFTLFNITEFVWQSITFKIAINPACGQLGCRTWWCDCPTVNSQQFSQQTKKQWKQAHEPYSLCENIYFQEVLIKNKHQNIKWMSTTWKILKTVEENP